jgi:hypothetical protein
VRMSIRSNHGRRLHYWPIRTFRPAIDLCDSPWTAL